MKLQVTGGCLIHVGTEGAASTLEIRTTKEFHDRFIVLDNEVCWHIGASIKDAGKKVFMCSQIEDAENRSALLREIKSSWDKGDRL